VRVDTGVRCGDDIGINYDPMIAKLIVHGSDRASALAKLARALSQYQVLGLNTNLGFLATLVSMPEFVAADFDTSFIATHHQRLFAADEKLINRALVLAAAAMLPALDNRDSPVALQSPWDLRAQWRMNLPSRQSFSLEREASVYEILIENKADGWHFSCAEEGYLINGGWIDRYRMRLEINGETIEFPVFRDPQSISLCIRGQTFRFALAASIHGDEVEDADADHPRAPMSGAIVALSVAVGDTVAPGDTLVVVEAMKMEHVIVAKTNARVSEVLVTVGDQVNEGDTLVLLEVE
jgi:3-methylcrotonyl-CoA carboxylase alpha subunit